MKAVRFRPRTRVISLSIILSLILSCVPSAMFVTAVTPPFVGDGFTVDYQTYHTGGNTYSVECNITNTGSEPITNWAIGFALAADSNVTNIWSASVALREDDYIIIKNAGWNADIAPGASVNFGMQLAGEEATPEVFELVEPQFVPNPNLGVAFNLTDRSATTFFGQFIVTNSGTIATENWVFSFDFPATINNVDSGNLVSHDGTNYTIKDAGWNAALAPGASTTVSVFGDGDGSYDVSGIDGLMSVYMKPRFKFDWDNLDRNDNDGDSLINGLEKYFGTDKENPDTDGDGLPDGVEALILYSDPLVFDSDIDPDKDGLTNLQEFEIGTDLRIADTDDDGLSDGDEVHIYNTDPLLADTDNDTLPDGYELEVSFNPLAEDSDNNGIPDGNEIHTYTKSYIAEDGTEQLIVPTVELTGEGSFYKAIRANNVSEGSIFEKMTYFVGEVYDFEHDEDLSFESSSLSFMLDDQIFNSHDVENLAIAYFNYDTVAWEFQETAFDEESNTLRCVIDHYSSYAVIDIEDFLAVISAGEDIANIIQSRSVDIVFAIDTTGSMGNYIQTVGNNVEALVDQLVENEIDVRFGLVTFKDIYADGLSSTINYGWYTNSTVFKNQVKSLSASGGGDTPETPIDAFESARNMEWRTPAFDNIILVTDAGFKNGCSGDISRTMMQEIEILKNRQIAVTVMAPSGVQPTYQSLVQQTEGVAINLVNGTLNMTSFVNKVDEKADESCWISTIWGLRHLAKNPLLGDTTVDSDEDGLPDLVEIISPDHVVTIDGAEYTFWKCNTDPKNPDTDNDGLYDGKARKKTGSNKIIAPCDPDPKHPSGAAGLWQAQVDCEEIGGIPTEYTSSTGIDAFSAMPDGFDATVQWLLDKAGGLDNFILNNLPCIEDILPENHGDFNPGDFSINDFNEFLTSVDQTQKDMVLDFIVNVAPNGALDSVEKNSVAQFLINRLKNMFVNGTETLLPKELTASYIICAVVGPYLLNFIYDDHGMALHSQPETWQKGFGYTELYDRVFKAGTSMEKREFSFTIPGTSASIGPNLPDTNYILWAWKGDYWNCGAGTEIGLYKYNPDIGAETPDGFYNCIDFTLPMELKLFNFSEGETQETIFAWSPTLTQWWITGFNPNYMDHNAENLRTIGKVVFSESAYNALKTAWEDPKNSWNWKDEKQSIIFGDDGCTVWTVW